jgi:hypothetical protein
VKDLVTCTPGLSIYPIRPGAIFKLKHKRTRWNKHLKREVAHTVFLWIQTVSTQSPQGKPPKLRPAMVFTICVPDPESYEDLCIDGKYPAKTPYLTWRKPVQVERIARQLQHGYELMTTSCKWYGKIEDYGRAYRIMQL